MSFFDWLRRFRAYQTSMRADTDFARFTGAFAERERPQTFDVPENLMARSRHYFTSDQYLAYQERADWFSVDVRIKAFAGRFIHEARRRLIPLYVHTAHRSFGEQDRLEALGRSTLRPPIAPHCQGFAVDIVHANHHWQMEPDEWLYLAKIGKECARKAGIPIEWGGDWSFYDPAHWQIKHWASGPMVYELPAHDPVRITAPKLKREFGSLVFNSS